ncbi:MAG: peptidoglycan DD-metalloendopeptidase family protein [Treponema sp.]|jgi:murein DD-endopeptidase MepM/ murein hydrolase activator NlpD|nr:peptidoglycan DD-metalloendopeptidase family protein [Treponema sp.]
MIDANMVQHVESRRPYASFGAAGGYSAGYFPPAPFVLGDHKAYSGAPRTKPVSFIDQLSQPVQKRWKPVEERQRRKRKTARKPPGLPPVFPFILFAKHTSPALGPRRVSPEHAGTPSSQELPGLKVYGSHLHGAGLLGKQSAGPAKPKRAVSVKKPPPAAGEKPVVQAAVKPPARHAEQEAPAANLNSKTARQGFEQKPQTPGDAPQKPGAKTRAFGLGGPAVPPDGRAAEVPGNRASGSPAPARPFPVFIYSLFPLLGFLGLALYFLGVSSWSWPNESSQLNPLEDTSFQQNLASYAGLVNAGPPAPIGEEIPLDMVETFVWRNYRIKNGDSVSKIAAKHGVSMDAVIASNGMANARRLYAGRDIRIPNMDGIPYTVKKGDSFSKISAAMGVPLPVILDANDIQSDILVPGTVLFIPGARMKSEELKLALGDLFVYPVRGRLTSGFGWRSDPISRNQRYHAAVDIAAPRGAPIKAVMDGKVATVGYNATFGNFIILVHSGGFQSMYAHMSKTSVSKGAYAAQGTKIGEVGSTGYSTGNHLHFSLYKNGRAVNPLEYLSN